MAIPFANNNNVVRSVCKHVGGSVGAYNNNSDVLDVMESMEWEVRFSCLLESPPATASYLICEFLTTNLYLNRGIVVNTDGRIYMKGANSDGYGYMVSSAMGLIADGKIHDVIVRRKDSTFYTVVDGITTSAGNGYGTGSMAGDCNVICIGQGRNSADWTRIYYPDDFYIWNVSFNKNNWVKGIEYPFTEGAGTSSYDINGKNAFGTIQGWTELNMTTREASVNYSGNDENTLLLLHGDDKGDIAQNASAERTITYSDNTGNSSNDDVFGDGSFYSNDNSISISGGESDWYFGTDDFTIDCWFNIDTLTGWKDLISCTRSPNSYVPFLITFLDSNLLLYSSTGSGWSLNAMRVATSVTTNVWHHVAITRSGSTFRTFYDGALITTNTSTHNLYSVASWYMLGSVSGNIDEVRFSNIARWTQAFTPPTYRYGDVDYSI